ncbi:MAG: hypothetical protein JW929_01370 [Anaerolineales bacterium]|nr:hypothetical protein [Anaerolineales bacterium]
MTARLTLEILTPQGVESVEDLAAVAAVLTDGSIGILPGHDRLLGETVSAPLICRGADGREREMAAGPGILHVEKDRVTVFAAGGKEDPRPPVRLLRNLRTASGENEADDAAQG